QARVVELGRVVVAVTRRLVDARRHQHAALVVEAQSLRGQAGPPGELSDADLRHADSLVAGPIRPRKLSVRVPPRAESSRRLTPPSMRRTFRPVPPNLGPVSWTEDDDYYGSMVPLTVAQQIEAAAGSGRGELDLHGHYLTELPDAVRALGGGLRK